MLQWNRLVFFDSHDINRLSVRNVGLYPHSIIFMQLVRRFIVRRFVKLKLILLIVISLLPASAQGMRWQALEEEVAADKSIDLDIFVDGLTISQDERYVVAWGNTPYLLENNSGLSKLNGGARNVRVIDLQQRRVISKGIFPSSPTSVLAIGDSIFVSLLGSRNRFDLINADPPLDGGEMEEALRDLYVYDRDTMKSLPKIRLPQPPKDLYTLPAQQLKRDRESSRSSTTKSSMHKLHRSPDATGLKSSIKAQYTISTVTESSRWRPNPVTIQS